jgi:uncharacterized membrane protein YraQ (UPF0718 family)
LFLVAATSSALLRRPAAGLTALAAVLVAVALAARALGVGELPGAQTFVVIFASITIEALPFVLLGAFVSALIEVYLPRRVLARAARMPLPLQLPAAALGGLAFPVCECGSVPVARRLIARGVHPAAGVAFMLAAPILNPVVLATTAIAYRGRGVAPAMVGGRALLGLLLAVVAGWAIGGDGAGDLLRALPEESPSPARRSGALGAHLAADFFYMGRYIVVGAALAAALQTLVPQSIVSGVARAPLLGTLALMALAYVLSLCSEADAFVAVSFVQFPLGAQLAFLVFGPAVDAKLSLLYGATFRRRFVARLLAVAVPLVLAGSLWFEVLAR